jgi:hypothetical protein
MTSDDLVFDQPPVMTAAHLDAMRTVLGWWPFPNMFDRALLVDIEAHLAALVDQPVPLRDEQFPITGHSVNVTAATGSQVWNAAPCQTEHPFHVQEPLYMTLPGRTAVMIKVEGYDSDGEPVTFEGEVTQRPGHDILTPIPFPDEDDEDDEPECTDQGEDPGPVDAPFTVSVVANPLTIISHAPLPYGMDVPPAPAPMPAKIIEVLQTWRPTPHGVTYHAVTHSPADWRLTDFAPLDMDKYESDQ